MLEEQEASAWTVNLYTALFRTVSSLEHILVILLCIQQVQSLSLRMEPGIITVL